MINTETVLIRLGLALVLGGIIGVEMRPGRHGEIVEIRCRAGYKDELVRAVTATARFLGCRPFAPTSARHANVAAGTARIQAQAR